MTPTINSDFTFEGLLTVGDRVPLSGGSAGEEFTMVGIPDAMGIFKDSISGENVLFVAHELTSSSTTAPFPGQTQLRGAFVSRFVLNDSAEIVEGGIAHSEVVLPTGSISNPVESDDAAFTRFCSGTYAGRAQGLSTDFFFTNEESGSGTFDDAGSQSVCVVDGKLHTLPDLGRVARENTIVMPRRDRFNVTISTEDAGTPSFIYLYLGQKQRRGSDVLEQNGFKGGKVYVLAANGQSAATFTESGPENAIDTTWVEIPGAAAMNDDTLKAAAGAAGGFGFVRVEDAEFDPAKPTRTLFVGATGGSGANQLGRLYEVSFDARNPVAPGKMALVYNADTIVTPGGDIDAGQDWPVSIDNIAVSKNFIVVQEDRNSPANAVFAKYNRDGGLWTLDRNNGNLAKYQADFNFEDIEVRDGHSELDPGRWESSGVIATDAIFGPDTFILNVQAHDRTVDVLDANGQPTGTTTRSIRSNIPNGQGGTYSAAEATDLFDEDGQVILMRLRSQR